MISVLYITARTVDCVAGAATANQYELLAAALRAQALHPDEWELVVVDLLNELPRPELAWLGDRVTFCRPRATPWDALNAFAPAVARNTALLAARGEYVFAVDDRVSFGPEMLAGALGYLRSGQCFAPMWVAPGDNFVESDEVQIDELCGGDTAYPRALAVRLGGHEERFVGCLGLEDWEFSRRMTRNGGRFVRDTHRALRVTCYKQIRHDAPRRSRVDTLRCPYAVDLLVRDQARANRPWTAAELACFTSPLCTFLTKNVTCGPRDKHCGYRRRPTAPVRRIMEEYESHPFSPFE